MTSTPDVRLVTLAEIEAAAERLRVVTVVTPLLAFGLVPAAGPAAAYLKPESLQPIGAFKLRGAYNAIAQLDPSERAAGVVAHSSGNHAQGVARAARMLGVHAVIVMPSDASSVKVERTLADGAEIVIVGPGSDERATRAAELAAERGLAPIPPYDDRRDHRRAGHGRPGDRPAARRARLQRRLHRPGAGRGRRAGERRRDRRQVAPPGCAGLRRRAGPGRRRA